MKYFIVIFLFAFNLTYGNKPSSNLYNKKGKLIADTNFIISKKQLCKFAKIETEFTKQLLDSIKISPILREDKITFNVILSFEVDQHSCFHNPAIEKFLNNDLDSTIARAVNSYADVMSYKPIMQSSCKYE